MTPRRRAALDAIADTFVPGAVERGVTDAFVGLFLPRLSAAERRRLDALLGLFAARGFHRLSRPRRERVLRAWGDSRIALRRAAFEGLRRGVLVLAWTLPGAPWDELGYPGPLGADPDAPPKPLSPIVPEGELALECDVCVIGSGAGGGPAAAVLAGAGLDVVVLEAGGYFGPPDFDGAELAGLQRLYLDGGTTATEDQSIGILAGACLGGGTVVNYTSSFRTPDGVRAEWGGPFTSDVFSRSLDAVSARLAVNTDHNRLSAREEKVRLGLERLSWHVGQMPRDVAGCEQGRLCGYCGYGCRVGAKRSSDRTWLVDAEAHGARIVVGARAERIVRGPTVEAGAVTVRAKKVVVACGALQTPALLRRSGLGNRWVGRNLRLHPVGGAIGYFDEEIRPWEGTLQAIYSDEFADLDGGYGFRYETTAVHPGLAAAFLPWRGAEEQEELMRGLARAVPLGVLLRDRGAGEVRGERPVVRYRLAQSDRGRLERGLDGAVQLLYAAGARKVVTSRILYSFHQLGTARLGASPQASACDWDGALWDAPDVVVCDGSTFPTPSGVNPMVTISAVAHMIARSLAARV